MNAALFLLLPAAVFGQAFDVTSVKPDKQAIDRSRRSELECSPGGRFVSRGNLLIRPIMYAGLGGDGWGIGCVF
jgi:hypothetical protein